MPSRVYLGRLSIDARERDIENFFKGYGHLKSILIKDNFAFIEFENYKDADDAVYELNGKLLCGDRVIVEHSKEPSNRGYGGRNYGRSSNRSNGRSYGRSGGGGYGGGGGGYGGGGGNYGRAPQRSGRVPERTKFRVVVENLSTRCSWQDLKDYMRKAGEVRFADAHRNREGEGVVEFSTEKDMNSAIEKLDGTELKGRKIKLIPPKNISRSRSKSDSRSRSRSNSSRSKSRSRHRSGSRNKRRSKSVSRDRSRSHDSRSWRKNRAKSRDKSSSRSASPKKCEQDTSLDDKDRCKAKSKAKSLDGLEVDENEVNNVTRDGSVSDSDTNRMNKKDDDYKKDSSKYENKDNFSSEDDKTESQDKLDKSSKKGDTKESEDDKYQEKTKEYDRYKKIERSKYDDYKRDDQSPHKERMVQKDEHAKHYEEIKSFDKEKVDKYHDCNKDSDKPTVEEKSRDKNKELICEKTENKSFKDEIYTNKDHESISTDEEKISIYKSDKSTSGSRSKKMNEKSPYEKSDDDEYYFAESSVKTCKPKDTNNEVPMQSEKKSDDKHCVKTSYNQDIHKGDYSNLNMLAMDEQKIKSVELQNDQAEIHSTSMCEVIAHKSTSSNCEELEMNPTSTIKSPEPKESVLNYGSRDINKSPSKSTDIRSDEDKKGSDKYDPLTYSDDSDEVAACKKVKLDQNFSQDESGTSLYHSVNESIRSSSDCFMSPNHSQMEKLDSSLDSSQTSQTEDLGKKSRRTRKAKSPPKEQSPEKQEGPKRSLRNRAKAEVVETQNPPSRKRK